MLDPTTLKICFIAGTLARGGAERQLYYMLRALTNNGVQCRLLSLTSGEAYEAPIRELGVPITWVGKRGSRVSRLLRITYETRKWRPHIVQSTHVFTNVYSSISAKVAQCIDIGAIRTDGAKEITSLGFWGRMNVALPTVLIANSRQAIATMTETGIPDSKLYLLENAVDCDMFKPPYSSYVNTKASVTLLAVGTLKQQKRHDIFLHIISQIKKDFPHLRARIAGGGPLFDKLNALSIQLDIQDVVEFMGPQSSMPKVYHDADLLVHCSDYEGMPNVIMEAMATGLPVIATHAGAAPDLVEHGKTGYLSNVGDSESLTKHVIELLSNTELRRQMGQASRAKMVQQFSLDTFDDKLLKNYADILGEIQ